MVAVEAAVEVAAAAGVEATPLVVKKRVPWDHWSVQEKVVA